MPGRTESYGNTVTTFGESATFTSVRAAGLTGAMAGSRHVGGTVSGAPTEGTFLAGDFVTDQEGAVWICNADGAPGTWLIATGRGDGVTSVTAGDSSIGIGGPPTEPTIVTTSLDMIAAAHLTAGSVSMNSNKLTSLTAGSASGDAVNFSQLPSSGSPLAASKGGTGVSAAFGGVPTAIGAIAGSNGTLAAGLAPAVVSMTFAASILVGAFQGNCFDVTLTSSAGTLANPSSPTDAQEIMFRVTQGTGAPWTLAYGTAYDFGAGSAPSLSSAAGKVDVLRFMYNAALSKWCFLSVNAGF
jgi:hypothetical protein